MRRFWRRRTGEDFSDEIQAHLDLETDRLVAEGLSAEAARDEARRSFGNVTRARERFHEASRWAVLEQFAQDVRYGWRGLVASPSFAATTVLTLAVGIGLVTAAFAVVNAYVLKPYAVRDPYGLHLIAWRAQDAGGVSFRWSDYVELRQRHDLFDAVVAEDTRFVSAHGRPLAAALVSDNYFDALGPRLLLGRGLGPADAGAAAGGAVVLSYQGWTRIFAGDPAAIGREVDLNGRRFVVVGVMRPEFTGLDDMPRDLWVELTSYAAVAQPDLVAPDGPRSLQVIARLRPGVPAAQAESALGAFMARVVGYDDRQSVRAHVRPQPSANPLSAATLALLAPVFAAFGLVLVTACANVSNVMLARAIGRHREIAVRLSLGASRPRVIRQLLTEGLLIALLAGAAGLALAAWALRAIAVTFYATLPPSIGAFIRLAPMSIDHRVFLFALLAGAAATGVFALAPALRASRLALTDALRGQGSGTLERSRLRGALVAGQVAVSLVLVIVAVTLARNGAALGSIDPGYTTEGVISVNVRGENDAFARSLAAALSGDPRAAAIAVTGGNPLFIRTRAVAAVPAGGSGAVATRYTFVSPEYFRVLRIPIVRGRGFRVDEARSSAPVAVVSRATAETFWPGEDPVGRTIRIERSGGRTVDDLPEYLQVTVVGTVRDVVSGILMDGQDAGHIYLPIAHDDARATAVLVRGRTEGDLGPEALQQIFKQVAPDPEVFEALPLGEMRDLQVYPFVAASWVGSILGLVALALSVSGLYGVLSYALSQRTKEIGIRMALGATSGAVLRLVVLQSTRLAGAGAAIGLVVSFASLKLLSSAIQLRTVSFLDIAAFGAGLALVAAAVAAAAYLPARRATRVDPSRTLRADA